MVTGVETAGLILAILPLLVNQIDGYARGLEKIRSLRRYRRELMRYSTGLSAQHVILLNTLELSLEGVVDNHDERWELINNPRGAGWASTQFQEKLRGKLGRNYDVFVSITKQLSDMLEELSEKLDLDETDKLNTESPDIVQRLKFRMFFSKSVYDDLLSKIDNTNQILRTLSEQSRQRSMQSLPDGGPKRWQRVSAKCQAARRHAKALYNAVIYGHCWQYACRDEHSVYLELNTTSARDQPKSYDEEDIADSAENTRFTMVISSKKLTQVPSCSDTFWYEIETESCPEPTVTAHPFNPTPGVSPPNSGEERVCLSTLEARHMSSPASPIRDLCAALESFEVVKPKFGLIGYIPYTSEGIWYNVRIIRDLGEEFQALSLHDIILASASNQSLDSLELSRRDRLFIATILASGLLQFHGTWLKEQWSSHDITFPQTGRLSNEIIHYPYLSWKVLGGSGNNKQINWYKYGGTKSSILMSLALTLVELSLGQTISELYSPGDSTGDDPSELKTAARVLPKVYRESGSNYGDVVKECLYPSFSIMLEIGDKQFEELVYEFIVSPLLRDFEYFEGLSTIFQSF